jgi:hypothetical protein
MSIRIEVDAHEQIRTFNGSVFKTVFVVTILPGPIRSKPKLHTACREQLRVEG